MHKIGNEIGNGKILRFACWNIRTWNGQIKGNESRVTNSGAQILLNEKFEPYIKESKYVNLQQKAAKVRFNEESINLGEILINLVMYKIRIKDCT